MNTDQEQKFIEHIKNQRNIINENCIIVHCSDYYGKFIDYSVIGDKLGHISPSAIKRLTLADLETQITIKTPLGTKVTVNGHDLHVITGIQFSNYPRMRNILEIQLDNDTWVTAKDYMIIKGDIPTEEVKLKLEVGKHYLTASGEIIEIYHKGRDFTYPFISTQNCAYTKDGIYNVLKPSSNDLIAEVPEDLHRYLCMKVLEYHTNPNVKRGIDNYKKGVNSR